MDATRRKVQRAVEALHYSPNAAARSLRTLRSGRLLVTVPDISNPFFSLIIQDIEEAAHQAGYAVLLGDARHDDEREERYAVVLQRKEAEGLFFFGTACPNHCDTWWASAHPLLASSTAANSVRAWAFRACISTTTVSQPMLEIGKETVRLMLEILRGVPKRPNTVTLPHNIVVRESTAKPRK